MRGATLATLALASCVGGASGACPKDCSGHGTCGKDGTTCVCDPGWGAGPDEGDCALAVVPLTGGEAVAVEGLAVGAWAYFSFEVPGDADVFVVEAVDRSGAGADPRLFGARGALPTLTEYSDADWRDWFYDLGDVHYVEGYGVAGDRYFVGLYNDKARGTEAVYANVTVRFGSVASPPCLLDCGAHGTCDAGVCECEAHWTGAESGHPNACQFEVRPLDLAAPSLSSLRIGHWDYYVLDVDEVSDTSLLVEFYSDSPESYPIVLAREGAPPELLEGWLPGLDTFLYDAADGDAFEQIRGQRQSIKVRGIGDRAATWYVGVYNLWGAGGGEVSARAGKG